MALGRVRTKNLRDYNQEIISERNRLLSMIQTKRPSINLHLLDCDAKANGNIWLRDQYDALVRADMLTELYSRS